MGIVSTWDVENNAVRILAASLREAGHHCAEIYFKDWLSNFLEPATDTQLDNLIKVIRIFPERGGRLWSVYCRLVANCWAVWDRPVFLLNYRFHTFIMFHTFSYFNRIQGCSQDSSGLPKSIKNDVKTIGFDAWHQKHIKNQGCSMVSKTIKNVYKSIVSHGPKVLLNYHFHTFIIFHTFPYFNRT